MLAGASETRAQDPIETNDFSIDMVQGPVLSAGRIVGLGGAYTALAEGVDGSVWNPAAYASRSQWENDWFEWEITIGFLFPGSFGDNDFFNTGTTDGFLFRDFVFTTGGFRLQFDRVGLGAIVRDQTFTFYDGTGDLARARFSTGNVGIAHLFLQGQLVVGYAARLASLTVTNASNVDYVDISGVGPEVGALVRIAGQPWRAGVSFRSAVDSDTFVVDGADPNPGGVVMAGGLILPRSVYLPWEVQAGFAFQVGRPMNVLYGDPDERADPIREAVAIRRAERARRAVEYELGRPVASSPDPYRWLERRPLDPRFAAHEARVRPAEDEEADAAIEAADDAAQAEIDALERRYLLVTFDALLSGPAPAGVGVEGFLAQVREVSGARPTLALRLGVESELVPRFLKLRAGTYLEPSRFEAGSWRPHVTGGFDVRLFSWDFFGILSETEVRAGVTIDVADRYTDWGVGVGIWH